MNQLETHSLVTCADLLQHIAQTSEQWLLLDVRPEADFESAHLPRAVQSSVYEMAFVDRMPEIAAPGDERSICVYGNGPDTHEARMAAEKLVRMGYRRVFEFRGGLEEWMAAGGAVEGVQAPKPAEPAVPDSRMEIDLTESRIEWIGRNLLNRHHGTIELVSGYIDFRDGLPAGGEFVIDMNSIACTNLSGDPLHDVLVGHLQGHDFFDTEIYPQADYRILSTRRIEEATPGAPNLHVDGELSIKGKTLPLSFAAVAGFTGEGQPAAQAVLAFDRTHWNVIYGSARFFRNLGMHLVNDLIEIQLRIVCR